MGLFAPDHRHTPGPWGLGAPGSIYEGHIISTGNKPSRGTLIADMVGSIENKTIAADARLIAAAPDMLNALKAALAVVVSADPEKVPRLAERRALVEAAITKAEAS